MFVLIVSPLKEVPWERDDNKAPRENTEDSNKFRKQLKEVNELHKTVILKQDQIEDEQSIYNFPIFIITIPLMILWNKQKLYINNKTHLSN